MTLTHVSIYLPEPVRANIVLFQHLFNQIFIYIDYKYFFNVTITVINNLSSVLSTCKSSRNPLRNSLETVLWTLLRWRVTPLAIFMVSNTTDVTSGVPWFYAELMYKPLGKSDDITQSSKMICCYKIRSQVVDSGVY